MSEKKSKRAAEHKAPAAYVVHTPRMRDGEPFAEALRAIYESGPIVSADGAHAGSIGIRGLKFTTEPEAERRMLGRTVGVYSAEVTIEMPRRGRVRPVTDLLPPAVSVKL